MSNQNGADWRTLRALNREGCEFGRTTNRDLEACKERMSKFEQEILGVKKKIDRLTWALASAALGFAISAVMFALNLLT